MFIVLVINELKFFLKYKARKLEEDANVKKKKKNVTTKKHLRDGVK